MAHIGKHVVMNDPAYVHETAYIYGKVRREKDVSIWPYVVMRAEMHEIVIGERTNIQDFVMVHVGGSTPTIVGKNCSIDPTATSRFSASRALRPRRSCPATRSNSRSGRHRKARSSNASAPPEKYEC